MRPTPAILLLSVLLPWLAHGQPGVRSTTSTPPRLALVDGQVSFWRPGANEWTAARANMPLGTGDALFTGPGANAEVQIGPAAYLRLGPATYVELSEVVPEQLQLKLSGGDMVLDLRELPVPRGIEVAMPTTALTIDRAGYYRMHADDRGSAVIARRGGVATATPGRAVNAVVRTGEELAVTSDGAVHRFAAPEADGWDRWNTARTDRLIDALSARYVADGIYGIADLDDAGTWRSTDEFGPVWIPHAVGPGWVPFGVGDWVYDATYGWTWVDAAPWGWAPFHHGRWVTVDDRWAWAPGPANVVPAYAPAMVGWLEGGPGVGWVALGWGEPIFPWWGAPGVAGAASWAGWGGPWVVNRAPIEQRMAIYASNVNYANATVPGAVLAASPTCFGRAARDHVRASPDDAALMRPREGGAIAKPVAASLAPTAERAPKPPGGLASRRVVATRVPPDAGARARELGLRVPGTAVVHLVLPPPRTPPSTGDRPPEATASAGAPAREGAGGATVSRVPRLDAPLGAPAGFAARPEAYEPPPLAPPRLEPEPLAALPTTTSSSTSSSTSTSSAPPLLVPSTTMVVTTTTAYAPPTAVVTPPTYVSSTTLVPAPAPDAGFQGCTTAGAPCGPCSPSGEMSMCFREVGYTSAICVQPHSCRVSSCLYDRDCGPDERCVQNAVTLQNNCCTECIGMAARRDVEFTLSTTTTSSTVPTTAAWIPEPTTTSTTTALPSTTTLAPPAEATGFQGCTAPGAECGPCSPSGEMSKCFREIGKTSAVCTQPRSCAPAWCLWDRDCGPGERCLQNPETLQNNCCDECIGVAAAPTWLPPTTSTTLAPAAEAGAFQACTAIGAACGPCPPSGEMSRCYREIGYTSTVCAEPHSCRGASCLWDSDCGPYERCLQDPDTLRANCCRECRGEAGAAPAFVPSPTTTTSSTVVVTYLPAPTTSTTLASVPEEITFQSCIAAGAACGPCWPSGRMAVCLKQIGKEAALCMQPETCVASSCLWDRDCAAGQRCVLNPTTLRTNCCTECTVVVRQDRPLAPLPTTTSTVPHAAPPTSAFRPCAVAGETCGPCAPSGLLTLCQDRIGGGAFCPKPGSCVDVPCKQDSDCLSNQRCIVNSVTQRTNCCEECESQPR